MKKNLSTHMLAFFCLAIFFTSCQKEESLELLQEQEITLEETSTIDLSRIQFENGMLVFESLEHLDEVLTQLEATNLSDAIFTDVFPEFQSFDSEYNLIKDEWNGEQTFVRDHSDIFASFEENDGIRLRAILPPTTGIAMVSNKQSALIIGNEILKSTIDKTYKIERTLLNDDNDIYQLIRAGKFKDVAELTHSFLAVNRGTDDDCTSYVSGENRRLQGEIGHYAAANISMYCYADSNYEKKVGWWWDDITYMSCKARLYVSRVNGNSIWSENEKTNSDDLVATYQYLGLKYTGMDIEDFANFSYGQHYATVSFNGTHNLYCSNFESF